MEDKIKLLKEKLADKRSKKVIFVSHCLLNENTRYLGGATRKAAIDEIIDRLRDKEIGIVQMKCPEQKAWGGVLKKDMLRAYGAKNVSGFFKRIYLKSFIKKTINIYQALAEEVADEIEDYKNSGFEVLGIICVKGSPSCGLSASLDLKKSSDFLTNMEIETLNKESLNSGLYDNCLTNKEGLFIGALKKELTKRQLDIPFLEHDLLLELKGGKSTVLAN